LSPKVGYLSFRAFDDRVELPFLLVDHLDALALQRLQRGDPAA